MPLNATGKLDRVTLKKMAETRQTDATPNASSSSQPA
jgi:hypothetical protein